MSMFSSAIPANVQGMIVASQNMEFNETDNELIRGNTSQIIMSARSVSASTAVLATNYGRGIIAWAEVTSGLPPGSGSTNFALKVQMVSPVGTNRFVTLAATTGSRSSTGIVSVAVCPGATALTQSDRAVASAPVPRDIRILFSFSTAAASVGCVLALGMSTIK